MKNEKIYWNLVNWTAVEFRVNRIQKRIYNASKAGNRGRVIFLQNVVINSLDAKLLAVRRVTTDSSGKNTPGVDSHVFRTPLAKTWLVYRLRVDGKAAPIRRVWIPKPDRLEKHPLGIPIILDRAKQKLVLMALEPEWEAKFEPGSYGFRPGRSPHDAIEACFRYLRNKTGKTNVKKFIMDADLKRCFDNIDHDYLLAKLECSPRIALQIRAWLKAGIFEGLSLAPEEYGNVVENCIGTPQGGVISPFLTNVALHGMESFIKDWICTQTWPVEKANRHQLYTRNKRTAIGVIRYADDFVIIHSDKGVVERAQMALGQWLRQTSKLQFNAEKTNIRESTQGFNFLGFSIINVVRNNVGRIKIYPSKKNQASLIKKVGDFCRTHRSLSSYQLVKALRPRIIGWANYFRYSECKQVFSNLDKKIFDILRAWVFRRDRRNARIKIKEKYFPEGKTYVFDGREYKNNWVLCGRTKSKTSELVENWLPKLTWVASAKYVSVRGKASVYDGNDAYWSLRTLKHGGFNTRQRNLLKSQKGYCTFCGEKILDNFVQVDHITPLSKGGKDRYGNLQLLHIYCHVRKTAIDNV